MEKAEIASCSRYLRARVSRLVVGVLLSGFRRGNRLGFTHAVDRRHFCVNFGGRSGVLRVGVRVPTCAPAGSERARRAGGEGRGRAVTLALFGPAERRSGMSISHVGNVLLLFVS